jgi:hypothetical protein
MDSTMVSPSPKPSWEVRSLSRWNGSKIRSTSVGLMGVPVTTDPTGGTVSVVRFYVPALGTIALLGAWLVTRLPGRAWLAGLTTTAVITALFGLGVWAFYAMYAAIDVPLHG